MDDNVAITIGMHWKREPGDGSRCCHCADVTWLAIYRMILEVDGKDQPQDIVLCSACGEVVTSE